MSTPLLRPVASITVDSFSISPSDGDVVLDAMSVPYAAATIKIPLTDPAVVEALDPREDVRVSLTSGDALAGTSRAFDLALRSREVDHKAKTVTLSLASDEALLQDWAPLTRDDGAWEHQSSLRDVCNYVLDKIGAELAAGGPDADVTAFWELTNMMPNPTVQNALGSFYGAGAGTSAVDYSTAVGGWHGTSAVRWTAGGTGLSQLSARQHSATPGKTYTASAYVRQGNGRQVRLRFNWRDSENELLGTVVGDPVTADGTWNDDNRVTLTARVPPGTARIGVLIERVSGAAGEFMYADAVMLYEGSRVVPFFTPGTPGDGYTAVWADTNNQSPSTRIPDIERDPELYDWPAGMTAWAFLQPITASAGLRLFCDEHRVWRLVDPAEYSRPGVVSVAGWNAAEGIDQIDRAALDVSATGVVVRYKWRDRDGIQHEQTDGAGLPGRVAVIELDRPYPGPGAAAAILARRDGQGRVQDVTAIANWTVAPGQQASISLPGAPQQIGQVQSVQWWLTNGLMRVGTRALTDLVPGSINALLGTINDLVGTIDGL